MSGLVIAYAICKVLQVADIVAIKIFRNEIKQTKVIKAVVTYGFLLLTAACISLFATGMIILLSM